MLRFPRSPSARAIGHACSRPQSLVARRQAITQKRYRADINIPRPANKASIKDAKPPVFPGGASSAAPAAPAPAPAASPVSPPPKTPTPSPATPVTPSSTAATQVPLVPPTPTQSQTSPPAGGSPPPKSSTPPPTEPPTPLPGKAPKKKHRIRNFFLGLTLLTGGAFAGGVFYSLKSDNFHDFFTEYIPFGEDAVLYLEEREFRRRFPNALSRVSLPKIDSPKVTIPKSAGATWKIAQGGEEEKTSTDVGKHGPHISGKKAEEQQEERAAFIDGAKTVHPDQGASPKTIDEQPLPKSKDTKKVEAVSKPAKSAPVISGDGTISTIQLDDVKDPVVHELANVVNSIIKVVNQSGSQKSFSSALSAAKEQLENLNNQIGNIKSDMEQAAKKQLTAKESEFDKAAEDMMSNVKDQFGVLEQRWQDEFEDARAKLAEAYRERLQTELARSAQVNEQRLHNELLEQAIEMKRQWVGQIESRVESERSGRLGKLQELTDAVSELEKLATSWTDVIDTNLKTQQMFAAIEAVKAAYESPAQPTPFLKEMAALKEVADDNDLVRAAISSVNPLAYQRGVSTPSQLVDRFRKVSVEVRKAALLPEDAGVAGHASSWFLSKLLFKKQGLPQTQDVESILTRTETYLEEGDLDNAAREMNQLSGWARVLARDWLKEARLLLEVQQAVDVITAEARIQSLRVQQQQ